MDTFEYHQGKSKSKFSRIILYIIILIVFLIFSLIFFKDGALSIFLNFIYNLILVKIFGFLAIAL